MVGRGLEARGPASLYGRVSPHMDFLTAGIGTLTYDVCATTLHIDHLSPERLESIEKSPSVMRCCTTWPGGRRHAQPQNRIRENRGRESWP